MGIKQRRKGAEGEGYPFLRGKGSFIVLGKPVYTKTIPIWSDKYYSGLFPGPGVITNH
jgi:hypothetical protein